MNAAKPSIFLSPRILLPSFVLCAVIWSTFAIGTIYDSDVFQDGEPGPLEHSQNLVLFICLLLAIWRAVRARGVKRAWLILVTIAIFLILGEEVSWGQWLFEWSSPQWFLHHNGQQETNLHNLSWSLNILPRFLLRSAIVLGGLIYPLARLKLKRDLLGVPVWLPPTMLCVMPALFAVFSAAFNHTALRLWLDLNYFEVSELEELFIYLFFFAYLVAMPADRAARVTD